MTNNPGQSGGGSFEGHLYTERFLRLLMANQHYIHAYILTFVPNWVDADDLLQEATAVMWRKFAQLKSDNEFSSWAISIARYEILNYRRKNRNSKIQFNDELLEILHKKVQQTDHKNDYLQALQLCLSKLNATDRRVVMLRYEEDVTIKQLGEKIGRSAQGIYKTMSRIHDLLLQCVRRTLVSEEVI